MNVPHVFEKKKYSLISVKSSICIHKSYLGIMLFRFSVFFFLPICPVLNWEWILYSLLINVLPWVSLLISWRLLKCYLMQLLIAFISSLWIMAFSIIKCLLSHSVLFPHKFHLVREFTILDFFMCICLVSFCPSSYFYCTLF